ncbi:phage recombination protein Bet [Corallococcus sp. EGB]|uniref:phage recombination protein Bet n=1 Tax=Corallococcus sp. EGB TaxID=1521117 RepID=UPI001CBDF792|nr:phage recombination protein Bet [Corallococcus sp. EGB]
MADESAPVSDRGWSQDRVDLVKRTICPRGISEDEFLLFMEQCKRSGLDPLLKEAFCVARRLNIGNRERPNWVTKHEFQPSEAGMLARAERFPDYEGIQAAEVYGEDPISIDYGSGTVEHRVNPAQRKGALVGAWARVQRRGKVAVVVWVDFAGVVQQTPLWGKMPGTMVRKCARVAALRTAYPEAFGGLYVREEMPEEEDDDTAPQSRERALPSKSASTEAAEVAQASMAQAPRAEVVEHHGQRRVSAPASARTARQVGGPEDESTAIVAEAEQAATESELKALGARARRLPDGPLRASAAEALKAAGKRLGLPGKPQPAPEPGSGG